MKKVKETEDIFRPRSLLGKQKLSNDNSHIKCHGCGETGHIAKGNKSWYWKMKKKAQEYRKTKERGAQKNRLRNKKGRYSV